jgi:uncharacterized membrane protein YhaH (DUF805 family)
VLFSALGSMVFDIVDRVMFGARIMASGHYEYGTPSIIGGLFSLAIFLPSLAVWVRRLHDVGRSGWWWLLILIPLIGWIVLFVWSVQRGDVGPNEFGPDPIAQ